MSNEQVNIGGAAVFEVIHAHELEHILRQAHPALAQVQVTVPNQLVPWEVKVRGAYLLYGRHQVMDTEADLRWFKARNGNSAAHYMALFIARLAESIEKAADHAAKGTH